MEPNPDNYQPSAQRRVHFAGICGRVVGGLAMDLKAQGWQISGVDVHALAPMSDRLREAGINFQAGAGPWTVPADTDVIVTTSLIQEENSGVPQARAQGVPVMHLPAFLKAHCLTQPQRIVVAGTNGKTTTSAMLTYALQQSGRDPDYLIGGACPQISGMVRMRNADLAVLEGDEFVACFNEGIAKFHFYKPTILILTNVAFDHAEVYADQDAVEREFAKLIAGMPADGLIIAAEGTALDRLTADAPCRVIRVGWGNACNVRLTEPLNLKGKMTFTINGQSLAMKLYGRMNALNAALALTAAKVCGVAPESAVDGLCNFIGVADRCDVLMDQPALTVVTDNGYHPMALRESLAAMRMKFPGRRLVVAFQPRYTGGKGGFLHRGLPDALAAADHVILTPIYDYVHFAGGCLTNRILAADLRKRGMSVDVISKARQLPAAYRRIQEQGDVLFCSLAMFQEQLLEKVCETPVQISAA